jgi:hypothetical protein
MEKFHISEVGSERAFLDIDYRLILGRRGEIGKD